MNPQDYNIIDLIPQRPPFVMVDRILSTNERVTFTRFKLQASNIFCIHGNFIEPGMIENIAQTAAARAGYLCKSNNEEVRLGFIGSIKNMNVYFLPEVGQEIVTEVIQENQIMGVTIITGKVRCNDKLALECEVRIFLK